MEQGPNDRDTKKKIKQKPNNDEEYELSRFKPSLKTVLEVCIFVRACDEALTALWSFCRNMWQTN